MRMIRLVGEPTKDVVTAPGTVTGPRSLAWWVVRPSRCVWPSFTTAHERNLNLGFWGAPCPALA